MAPSRSELAAAIAAADPAFTSLIDIVGPPPARRPLAVPQRFERLATAILHQQLAGAAAATITTRTRLALGGAITPDGLATIPDDELRACGVSGAKAAALKDLSRHVVEGHLDLGHLGKRSDDDVIASLVKVRGVGQWTAEMFLMGPLGRHDVWPVGDLGVRSGWALVRREPPKPPKQLLDAADALRPWRSSVAWYCWQAVDVARSNGGVLPR